MSLFLYLLIATLLTPSLSDPCPLNIKVLGSFSIRTSFDSATRCQYILQAIHLVFSDYLRRTGYFLPPPNSSDSCWNSFQSFFKQYDIRSSCGIHSSWIFQGCGNITTRQQFEALVSHKNLIDVRANCNQSLGNNTGCALCTTTLSTLPPSFWTSSPTGKLNGCAAYTAIYAASLSDHYGPSNPQTANCLFSLDFASGGNKRRNLVVVVVVPVCCVLGVVGFFGCLMLLKVNKVTRKKDVGEAEMGLVSGLDSMNQSTTFVRFTFDEINKATRNFSGYNLIGKGGFGNVYKGVLSDGTQVAFKRFKNCSVAGDASFTHEVEVIASVRHVNLVALRGYCIATTNLEGHQRIIVTDLMENGSLHDHLFGSVGKKLSWPIRQKIALGTARGLAYLHYGAQPSIIHRDIKASNILLDEKFEAKVADFGLAKFNPEGMTHMSTRVAGTMGYVAPEYALYGQLTERSDVFSFGVVLLELLSGKKALQMDNDGTPSTLTDLAWSLVREGRALNVIEDDMPEAGPPQILEKYVLVAVLCSHPQLYARPTMDQVVKMLETDESVPSIPERPNHFIVGRIDDIEKSVSCNSGQLCSSSDYQAHTLQSQCPSSSKEDGSSGSRTVSTG